MFENDKDINSGSVAGTDQVLETLSDIQVELEESSAGDA